MGQHRVLQHATKLRKFREKIKSDLNATVTAAQVTLYKHFQGRVKAILDGTASCLTTRNKVQKIRLGCTSGIIALARPCTVYQNRAQ